MRLLPENKAIGWTPYAWLVYLPTFLIGPVARTQAGTFTAFDWAVTVAAMLAFLVSYFYGYWACGQKLVMVAVFQTTLGIAFAPTNYGSFVFFIYASSFAAQSADQKMALRYVLAITLLAAATAVSIDAPLFFWFGVLFTLLIGAINLHFARFARTQRRLIRAEEEIGHLAAVAERERIARDLHDVLGHTLSLIVLKSELASRIVERDPKRAAQEIGDVETVARKALHDVRETIRGFRPSLTDELVRAESLLKAAGIATVIERPHFELDKAREETLAFVLREAATNVARHSRATRCDIGVLRESGVVALTLADNGSGERINEGNGIRGMRERVEVFGGTVNYHVDGGVRLEVRIPVTA